MEFGVGNILDGKVTGITKFGAFVSLPAGKTGMVHISEIANTYVNDIREHLTEGQEVKVKVINIDAEGRINLSIKKASEPPVQAGRVSRNDKPHKACNSEQSHYASREPASFEDRLKQFMADSDSKISGLKQYSDKRGSSRKRK